MISFINDNKIALSLLIILLIFLTVGLKKGLIAMAKAVASIVLAFIAAVKTGPFVLKQCETSGITEKVSAWIQNLFGKPAAASGHSKLYELLGLGKIADRLSYTVTETIIKIICFILLFIIIRILVNIIVKILSQLKKIRLLKFTDRLLGGIFGLAEGIFVCWIVLAVIMLFKTEPVYGMLETEMLHAPMLREFAANNVIYEFICDLF